jgi:DNA-binding GntR family transcriptional regulator
MHTMRIRTPAANSLSPIERAYNNILDSILSGEFAPGARIPAETIAASLGISRMPVRDALRRLEADGAVTTFANRGASVAKYSDDGIVQLVEMGAVLEGLAARHALAHFGESEVDDLEEIKRRMDRSTANPIRWLALHDEFHGYVASLSGKPLLTQQIERIRVMLWPYQRRSRIEMNQLELLGPQHQKIIGAIRAKDPDRVEQTVRRHVLKGIDLFLPSPVTGAGRAIESTRRDRGSAMSQERTAAMTVPA